MSMLVEAGIIVYVAGAFYAVHYLAYGMTMQDGSFSRAEAISLVIMLVFVISYIAFHLGGRLWKAKGSWSGRPLKTATTTTIVVGLVLVAIAYLNPVDTERSPEVDLIIRSETTGDVWVIEAERKDDNWEVGVERDTVYLASATIIALATFGSMVTIRVLGKPQTRKFREQGIVMMSGGIGAAITVQSLLMYGACCGSMDKTLLSIFLVMATTTIIFVIIGFARILDSWLTDEKDPSKAPK